MSDESNALKFIAVAAGVEVSQLPKLSPSDFSASDWRALEYATGSDVRGSLMVVYRKDGANVVCPNCHRYATEIFFQRGKRIPTVFRCGYQNTVWYDTDADMVLVDRILRKYNARLWCEK